MLFSLQPLEQFEIYVISIDNSLATFFGYNVINIISNVSIIIFLIKTLSFFILYVPLLFSLTLIPNSYQSLLEYLYKFLADIVLQQVGKLGQQYFPFLFSMFTFILLSNLVGMVPYGFTITSHIFFTFTLSLSIFFFLTILGFIINKLSFLKLFVPTGIPKPLIPFLVIIELVSYVSRAFSLGIRLFANMMSGHALLFILSGFVFVLYNSRNFLIKPLFLVPFLIVLAITFLELGIAFLQAYVFVILICIYLNDSFHPAH